VVILQHSKGSSINFLCKINRVRLEKPEFKLLAGLVEQHLNSGVQ
jgi:hypothetical protein